LCVVRGAVGRPVAPDAEGYPRAASRSGAGPTHGTTRVGCRLLGAGASPSLRLGLRLGDRVEAPLRRGIGQEAVGRQCRLAVAADTGRSGAPGEEMRATGATGESGFHHELKCADVELGMPGGGYGVRERATAGERVKGPGCAP